MEVDLYVRVSTDEQADKGYSQRSQFEVLSRHCEQNAYRVRDVIYEDHSAKTFERPEWQKYLGRLKNRRKRALLLFTKWDRFSRNAGDAYSMINQLHAYRIEPQAIEQPLDMEIPESKIMLAIYLATPEVENDRRALNIFYGIRRATKEGRYLRKAPFGYKNKTREDGSKYIDVVEAEAQLIRQAFEEVSVGDHSVEQIFWRLRLKGLNITKSNFWRMLRNRHYIGKILVPAFKNEDAHYVEGQHVGIVPIDIFWRVQEVLDGKNVSKIRKSKALVNNCLPLRGFLYCPLCGGNVSGSGSRSKTGKYHYYYHCKSPCKFRIRAEVANDQVSKFLNRFSLRQHMFLMFKSELTELISHKLNENGQSRGKLLSLIEKANTKLSKARGLLLEDKIDSNDFSSIKTECQREIENCENQLAALKTKPKKEFNLMIDKGLSVLGRLGSLYDQVDVEGKKIILGSTFLKKMTFEDEKVRTPEVNGFLRLIYLLDSGLSLKKKGTNPLKLDLCRQVELVGFEPTSR